MQTIMAAAFATVPRPCGLIEEAPPPRRTGPAASTIMAFEYLVREGDQTRLEVWLRGHSADEIAQLIEGAK